jgi:hypothetical protein
MLIPETNPCMFHQQWNVCCHALSSGMAGQKAFDADTVVGYWTMASTLACVAFSHHSCVCIYALPTSIEQSLFVNSKPLSRHP